MAEDDWMKPITRPRPGPVAGEAMQMTRAERENVVLAGAMAAHRAAGHSGSIYDCYRGCLDGERLER